MRKPVMIRGMYSTWDVDTPRDEVITGEAAADLIRIQLKGYQPGDKLREAWRIVHHYECSACNLGRRDHDRCREMAAELICRNRWRKHNAEDRPDGQTNRSMCIGDVIEIAFDEQDIRRYAVRAEGFERIDEGDTDSRR